MKKTGQALFLMLFMMAGSRDAVATDDAGAAPATHKRTDGNLGAEKKGTTHVQDGLIPLTPQQAEKQKPRSILNHSMDWCKNLPQSLYNRFIDMPKFHKALAAVAIPLALYYMWQANSGPNAATEVESKLDDNFPSSNFIVMKCNPLALSKNSDIKSYVSALISGVWQRDVVPVWDQWVGCVNSMPGGESLGPDLTDDDLLQSGFASPYRLAINNMSIPSDHPRPLSLSTECLFYLPEGHESYDWGGLARVAIDELAGCAQSHGWSVEYPELPR